MTTVSDAVGAIHNPKGLDIIALRRHVAEGNKLADYNGGENPLPSPNLCGQAAAKQHCFATRSRAFASSFCAAM